MSIRQFRPMTAGTRFRSVSGFDEITRDTPEKSLLEPMKKTGGRNNQGHLTSRHRGGGHKRQYRKIDFKRNKVGIPGRVAEIEYDPNRTARIALIVYADGEKRYILHPKGLNQGDTVVSGTGLRHPDRQRAAAERDPARHHGAQHRAQDRQGRPALPHRRARAPRWSPRKASTSPCGSAPPRCG